MTDYTEAEYKKMLGYKPSTVEADSVDGFKDATTVDIPASVNWDTAGAVTGVKN